jgi:hypothetical protein
MSVHLVDFRHPLRGEIPSTLKMMAFDLSNEERRLTGIL